MNTRRLFLTTSLLILVCILFSAGAPLSIQAHEYPPPTPEDARTGAWVDTIHIRTMPNDSGVIDALQAGNLDMYATESLNDDLFDIVQGDPNLEAFTPYGLYYELTLNPAGPVFSGNGKLNPFAVPGIREAMNSLIDRRHLVEQVYGGMGISKFVAIHTGFPDFSRYQDTIQDIESYYNYDFNQAKTVISNEMLNLGASLVSGKWHYNGQPVELIFLIRTDSDGTRVPMGNYVAEQLEDIGFTVTRQYGTSSELSPLWVGSNPDDGLWHLYTGAWGTGAISRDDGSDFQFFYSPDSAYGSISPLWQAYNITPEFREIANKLAAKDYASWAERDQLFNDALLMSMEESLRVWLVDGKGYLPRQAETTAAYNLVRGLVVSDLWPYTVRFIGQEGGTMEIAQVDQLIDPWNPISGSNWTYDSFIQRATVDEGLVNDPKDGLRWPQRIESAAVTVEEGLPVIKTHDWLTLEFTPTITVPDDAWVDWNAIDQVWITTTEKYTQTQTAKIKSVVTYPSDLFTSVTWHDGSPLSVNDFVMAMIMGFDSADPDSPIYNEALKPYFDSWLTTFKGYRITSTDPLVIECYRDLWNLDAEWNVYPVWPDYGYGESAWHTMAVAYQAEADGALAFTRDKADAYGIEWMDFISQPSISTLKGYLDQAQAANFIPYANTLGAYITPAEATSRYNNLQSWYSSQGHFWIGTGPFYLDEVSYDPKMVTLQRNTSFPDPAGKWDAFSATGGLQPTLEINYASGAPGSAFNVEGSNYPINSFATISLNYNPIGTIFTGPDGNFTYTLTTEVTTEEGYYLVTASVNPAASLLLTIAAEEPIRPKEGDYPVYTVPDDVAVQTFLNLPFIQRE